MAGDDELGDGSWAEWRRAVLGEQRRFGRDLRDLSAKVGELAKHSDVEELERRIMLLEAWRATGSQRNEDRKWLIGLAVLVVASILMPNLRVLLFGGSP